MGSTCKYLGFSSNTTDPGDLKKVQDAVVGVKPHLKAFLNTNVGAGLVNGSTAMAMDWDYDVALLQQKNDKIKWVLPDEGVHAYLEGFTADAGHEQDRGDPGVLELPRRSPPSTPTS